MAQPALKTDELTNVINSLVVKYRKPSAEEIVRLKNELGKAKKIKDAEYYDFLGRIAYLENDRAKMIRHYEEALTHALFNKYDIQESYFFQLHNSGLPFKAREQLKLITEKFPKKTEMLKNLAENNRILCRFREAHQIGVLLDVSFLNQAIAIFDKADLSDDEAENLCKLAYSLLEIKNLYFSTAKWEVIDDCVFYTIYVDTPIKEVAKIDFELSYLFAEQLENMRDDVIVFEYKSVETLKK